MKFSKLKYELERFVNRATRADALDLVNFLEHIVSRKLLSERNNVISDNRNKYGFYDDGTPDWSAEED